MKTVHKILLLSMGIPLFASGTDPVRITMNTDSAGPVISRHIYGHFSEHLGRCIYGGLWVGEDSDIPNLRGFRKDVLDALKEIAVPNLRWPGGCFADTYHWMDGIGPREQRPEIVNVHWGGVTEDNSFGTHEFMDFCEELGCEPVFCGNLGSGTVREMAEWIEYLTSDASSPMTRLREANGRKEPWKVTYWGIGNESWGCGGNMQPEFYSHLLKQYAQYCRDMGGSRLYRIACGAPGSNYHWTDVLMREWAQVQGGGHRHYMQGLSLHHYTICHDWSRKGPAVDFDEEDWYRTITRTYEMETLVTKHDSIMNIYDPEKRVGLVVDEWGNWHDVEPGTNPGFLFQQNTLRDALVAGINLNIFNNHADRVVMANIAQVVNVLQAVVLTQENEMVKTPTWYVFRLYLPHHDATLIPIRIQSPEFDCEGTGMNAPYVTASASRNTEGVVHLSLTNADLKNSREIQCDLEGWKASRVSGEIITADRMNAYNEFGEKEDVVIRPFDGAKIRDGKLRVTLPAKSVVMLALK
ncbi:MAG TPA: alpha-N-arabinofuranosidase [bacterium]|nr:alpha-N-arabinofuranosidase [bacterium]